jgi:glycosyltransferase involved in cell wall biosynthesis
MSPQLGDPIIGMAGPILLSDFREYLHELPARAPEGLGGTPVNHLARELLRRGHRLVIFTLDPAVDEELVLAGPRLKICIGPFRYKRARDLFRLERRALENAMRRERPALVHAQWTYEFALAAIAAKLPHVVTAHDAPLQVLRLNLIPYRAARTVMAFRAVRGADRIMAVSPYVARHLERYFRPRARVGVIPNGLPAETFAEPADARRSAGMLTFATVLNGWAGFKNGQVAIDAFARFRRIHGPACRLIMFGAEHGTGEPAARWAHDRGIADGIEFAGATAYGTLQQRLASECDVLVHPALEEAHPMAVLEAQAKGIPVIGGIRSGGVPAALASGAGLLVDVTSASAVCDAMLRLAGDEPLRRQIAREGFRRARELSIEAVAGAWERTYEDVLHER